MTEFGDQVAKWTNKTRNKLDLGLRKVTLEMFSEVILMSPVDTGLFRSNWLPSIGRPEAGTVDIADPSGSVSIGRVQGMVQGVEGGTVVYLVNNLPYAERLENGWSNQAPQGMVALAVQRWQPMVAKMFAQLAAEN